MSERFYSSVKDVKDYTGIKPPDIGFKNDDAMTAEEKLEAFIEARLVEIKDLIDHDRNRDYHAEVESGQREKIPPGIHHIALRIMKNLFAHAVISRSTPIVRVDDFTIRMVEDRVFTPAIKKDLKTYPAKPRFRLARMAVK